MKLTETDWNAPGGAREIAVDYPDEPIAELVNFLRRSKLWKNNPGLIELRVRKLNKYLAEYHQGTAARLAAAAKASAQTAAARAAASAARKARKAS